MNKKWTRRRFLKTSLGGSVVAGAGVTAGFAPAKVVAAPQKEKLSVSGFDEHRRGVLRAAMDEIIPASDGMPAASQVGGVEYLDRLVREIPELKKELQESLAALEEISRKRFSQDFLRLSRAKRAEVLAELEKRGEPRLFAILRDSVYEAYYTQPRVWKLIGYESHPTNQSGPRMKPFDESVLSEVRKRPKLYREVS
jgi:hypothetical protein